MRLDEKKKKKGKIIINLKVKGKTKSLMIVV